MNEKKWLAGSYQMRRRNLMLGLLALPGFSDIARAASRSVPIGPTLHISMQGDDLSGTGEEHRPLRKPQRAADIVSPGETVSIQPGVYPPFAVTRSGTAEAPISLDDVRLQSGMYPTAEQKPHSWSRQERARHWSLGAEMALSKPNYSSAHVIKHVYGARVSTK